MNQKRSIYDFVACVRVLDEANTTSPDFILRYTGGAATKLIRWSRILQMRRMHDLLYRLLASEIGANQHGEA